MIAVVTPLFKPGRVLATPGAIDALEQSGQSVWHFLIEMTDSAHQDSTRP